MAAIHPGEQGVLPLDFTQNDDMKFYQKAIKGLDEADRYDLTPSKLKGFLDCVRDRVDIFGWNAVLEVPIFAADAAAPIVNLLNNYGQVSLTDCTIHATDYMEERDRMAQNASMMYHFLFASLTPEARIKVSIDPSVYTVIGIKDGLCFLRTIISKAQLDTMGTVEMLRSSLGELPTKIVEVAGNIVEFHQHVNTLLNALDSYGQAYPELILNLFKAYKLIEDKEFSTFIMITRYGYIANPNGYNPRTLMEGVENDYKIRVESGTWSSNIEKKETTEIAALRAEISNLRQGTTNKAQGGGGNDNNGAARRRREKNVWKKVPPAEGAAKTTTFEGRTYHWCGNHKMWTMHTEAECKGIDYRPNGSNNHNGGSVNNSPVQHPQAMSVTTNGSSNHSPVVRVNEAMQTIIEYSGNLSD
jgi:hypothetical protein